MIGLLDPTLFLPRPEKEITDDLDNVARACKAHKIIVPAIEEYWGEMWSKLGSPLEKSLSPIARRSVHEIRKIGTNLQLPRLDIDPGRVWRRGFEQLFGTPHLAVSWEERMAAAAIRALITGDEVVLLTRRILGRNLIRHASGDSTLDENSRWLLHVQPKGLGHKQVLCVHHPRNISERWTSRYDWRLPGNGPGVPYPFCPPETWWKPTTAAFRTISSKPAWIDCHQNGWARPNIRAGAGYHWDVFITSLRLQEVVGLKQINIVEYGAPRSEGEAGKLHHIPEAKEGKITGTGWQC